MIVPIHPAQGCEFNIDGGLSWSGMRWSVDQFSFAIAVDGLGERVVVGIADGPDRWCRVDLSETFAVAQGRK